jgi:retron-type reverse transcriptase
LEIFKKNVAAHLRKLKTDIMTQNYSPAPVRIFTLKKGKKIRELGILCIRDRIVHHALADLLTPLFEMRFSDCSFAFRAGKL